MESKIFLSQDSIRLNLQKQHQILVEIQKQDNLWKYFIPLIVGIVVALMTAIGNWLVKKSELSKTCKKERENKLRALISDYISECYTISGQIISSKQMYRKNPDEINIFNEYKELFANNKKAYILLNQIKFNLDPKNKEDHRLFNSKLDEYLDKTVVRLSGDEPKAVLEKKLDEILRINDEILEMGREIIKKCC